MIQPVLIFGAGALGKLALDVFSSNDLIVYGFLDDNRDLHGKEIGEIPILGHTEDDGFLKLIGKKCDAFIASEHSKERESLTEMIRESRHLQPVNAIHSEASVSIYSTLGHGNLIMAGARLGSFSSIGNGCIIHSNAVIEPDATLGDFVQVGSGSIVGEGVQIGDGAFIGAGVTLVNGVKIGKNASIGAGSVVMADVAANTRVFGVPAQKV